MNLCSKRAQMAYRVSSELLLFVVCSSLRNFVIYTPNRYILWVPWYMHLLVMFFDYFLCDGSHGFSKYGWKFIPLCILVSGGKTLTMAAVFALEEDSQALNFLLVSFIVRIHVSVHFTSQTGFRACALE